MTSWRSRFRRNRTSDTSDTKTSYFLFSKNLDDAETQRKPRSRFLRRSKHEDEGGSVRPQSMYVEHSPSVLSENSSQKDPPSIQEILDKNRNLRRSSSKSPKSWKRLVGGDKSPGLAKKSEHSRNNESNFENHSSKSKAFNEAGIKEKRNGLRGNDFDEISNKDRSSKIINQGNKDGDYKVNNNNNINENSTGRRISHIRREKSMQMEDSGNKMESPEKKATRSRSGSPYDNVAESSEALPRRERRPRSLYFEENQKSDVAETPRRERRKKANRNESEDIKDQQKETKITKKDSFVLRKPRAKYPIDDGDEDKFSEVSQVESSASYKEEKTLSKSTSVSSLRSNASSDKVDRHFGQKGYQGRNSENILGATMNYLENRSKSDLNSLLEVKSTSEYEDEADSFMQRRRRYQGLMSNRRTSTSTTLRYENPLYKSVDYPEYDRRSSSDKQSVNMESSRRDSSVKSRPKSLFSYGESIDFTDSLSKFQNASKNSSQAKQNETYSGWDRYKTKHDDDYEPSYLRKKNSVVSDDDVKPRQRPLSLFMMGEDKTTYRGNWSAALPKAPAHLRDFSVPDENAPRISYRRRKSKNIEKEDADDGRRKKEEEKVDIVKENYEKQESAPSFQINLESPKTENTSQTEKTSKQEDEVPVKTYLALPPEIEVEDTDRSKDAETKIEADDTEKVVVRRRRRERQAPARPSSFYPTKVDAEIIEDSLTKASNKSSEVDEDSGSRSRRTLLDSEDIKTGLRKRSAVERRIRSKVTERPKSVNLADMSRFSIHDPLRDSVDEVKRQFERLLRRTENWKQRTESLDSKANILTSSYRNLRRTITEIQGESDDVYAVFDEIGTRLTENDSIGFPSTEDDWRRAMQGNRLLEKAIKSLLDQQKNPKPEFYYSDSDSEPESRDQSFYGYPEGSPWSSPETHASRNRPASDYMSLRSSRGSSSESLSYSKSSRSDYYTSEYSPVTNTRLSPLMSNSYNRRKRFTESSFDYRRDISLRNTYARYIPETAV